MRILQENVLLLLCKSSASVEVILDLIPNVVQSNVKVKNSHTYSFRSCLSLVAVVSSRMYSVVPTTRSGGGY